MVGRRVAATSIVSVAAAAGILLAAAVHPVAASSPTPSPVVTPTPSPTSQMGLGTGKSFVNVPPLPPVSPQAVTIPKTGGAR